MTADCSQHCECKPNKQVQCTVIACNAAATCHLIDGHYQCVCNEGFHGDGYQCIGKSCLPTSTRHVKLDKKRESLENRGTDISRLTISLAKFARHFELC